MSIKLDLRTSFREGLKTRGVSPASISEHESVLDELQSALVSKPASHWRASDLEDFLTRRQAKVPPARMGIYGVALGLVTELIERAQRKGVELTLTSASGGTQPTLRSSASAPNPLAPRPPSPRPATSTSQLAPRPPAVRGASSPGVRAERGPEHASPGSESQLPWRRIKSQPLADTLGPGPENGQTKDVRDLFGSPGSSLDLGDDSAIGTPRRRRGAASAGHEDAKEDFQLIDLGFGDEPTSGVRIVPPETVQADAVKNLWELDPASASSSEPIALLDTAHREPSRKQAAPPRSGPELFLMPRHDTDVGVKRPTEPAAQSLSFEEVLAHSDTRSGEREPELTPAPIPVPFPGSGSAGAAAGPAIKGWTSAHRVEATADGAVVDERYTVPRTLPVPEEYLDREPRKMPSGLDEFVQTHRAAPPVLVVLLFAGAFGFLVHWVPAGLLLLGSMAGIGVYVSFATQAARIGSRPWLAATDEQAVREYLAAVRVGLFHRAKAYLASPVEARPVAIDELRATGREPLGARFNTLSPVALRLHWRGLIETFDDHEQGRVKRLMQRHFKPFELVLDRVLVHESGAASVIVARGGGVDDYVVIGVVKLASGWWIADGECVVRSTRLDQFARLAKMHARGRIDDNALLQESMRHNLTRADITRAAVSGALTEAQASMLARRALEKAQG